MNPVSALPFGGRRIGAGEPVLIIAEIGINHEGDAQTCRRMVEEAVAAGADAVKFQTIRADHNYAPDTESYRIFKAAELDREEVAKLFAITRALGAEPFTTAGDLDTLHWLQRLDPPGYKISSGLLTCTPVIRAAAASGKAVLMSTGMAQPDDIEAALAAAEADNRRTAALLQCTSLYPAPIERLDLAAIGNLRSRYGVPVGFSDHSIGIGAPALAVAAGAVMIEKHFSLDPSRPGFDHGLSLSPKDFRAMVESIRRAESAMGRPEKRSAQELDAMRRHMSRYLGAIGPVAKGEYLSERNIGFFRFKEPGEALPAAAFEEVLGAKATRDIVAGSPVTKGAFSHG